MPKKNAANRHKLLSTYVVQQARMQHSCVGCIIPQVCTEPLRRKSRQKSLHFSNVAELLQCQSFKASLLANQKCGVACGDACNARGVGGTVGGGGGGDDGGWGLGGSGGDDGDCGSGGSGGGAVGASAIA